jgi:hypothetical protein
LSSAAISAQRCVFTVAVVTRLPDAEGTPCLRICAELKQETLAGVPGRHARRIQRLHQGKRLLGHRERCPGRRRDLRQVSAHVPALVEAPDDRLAGAADRLVPDALASCASR